MRSKLEKKRDELKRELAAIESHDDGPMLVASMRVLEKLVSDADSKGEMFARQQARQFTGGSLMIDLGPGGYNVARRRNFQALIELGILHADGTFNWGENGH